MLSKRERERILRSLNEEAAAVPTPAPEVLAVGSTVYVYDAEDTLRRADAWKAGRVVRRARLYAYARVPGSSLEVRIPITATIEGEPHRRHAPSVIGYGLEVYLTAEAAQDARWLRRHRQRIQEAVGRHSIPAAVLRQVAALLGLETPEPEALPEPESDAVHQP